MYTLRILGIRHWCERVTIGTDQGVAECNVGINDTGGGPLKVHPVKVSRGFPRVGSADQCIAGTVQLLCSRKGTTVHRGLQLRFDDKQMAEVQGDRHES